MNRTLRLAAAALSAVLALPGIPMAAPADAAPARSNPARRAPPKKPLVAAPAPAPLAAASDEQKAAALLTHLGDYACEFDQVVKVADNALVPGYIDVTLKTQTWVMKPVVSSTGALRLEDVKGRMLMIQIANKSMVMDAQAGQRMVDGCQHEKQREFQRTLDGSAAGESLLKP